ncbi:MAG: hypothetical protein KJ559_01455 [Nanoarchaeota archaeon]|nr:hypothetical protein [Nanoarchaeota archaeon]
MIKIARQSDVAWADICRFTLEGVCDKWKDPAQFYNVCSGVYTICRRYDILRNKSTEHRIKTGNF